MNAPKITTILILFLIASDCNAQFMDNFSDGDFTANPSWLGDNSKFIVQSTKLKLQAPAVSEFAYLSTSSQSIHQASWEFYVQMDFTPSSTNLTRIYLASDKANLGTALNGYFVKVGNTTREVSLYRQNGTTETKIIDGLDDRVNFPVVKIRIKATRSSTGTWSLYSDAGSSGTYTTEGTATDNTFTISSYFGILCTYTSTRSDKFWFDDFAVTGIPVPDITPPSWLSVNVPDQQSAILLFSEPIDRASSENVNNYEVIALGHPLQATLNGDQKSVRLYFSYKLINGVSYALQVEGVRDLAGNPMVITRQPILFFKPVPVRHKDIILSEIFPDPSPQIGLPNAEFVEIYNRSQDPFNLGGWKLSDGSSTGIFPSQIILPGEYWIVASSSSLSLFTGFGKAISLSNFPTLNNSGDNITLRDANNFTVDSVHYALEWYRDIDKQDGGWSLELIDPANPCGEGENWEASVDPRGGTPGMQNSVYANKPDMTAPSLLRVFPETSTTLALYFNEKLSVASPRIENFILTPSVPVLHYSFTDISLTTILLDLHDSLAVRQSYSVKVNGIRDCNGNEMEAAILSFGLPEKPTNKDVVINEILFNPRPGGVDFVEVFNASPKFLNLKQWKIGTILSGMPTNISELFTDNWMISPFEYEVFTMDPGVVKLQYPQSLEQSLVKVQLPSLRDDQSSVTLLDDMGMKVDEVTYSKDWHSVFLKNTEGVSLERITPQGISDDRMNWTSAASVAGYATPGYTNSQLHGGTEPLEGEVLIVPELFFPGLGMNDFIRIDYHFDQGGWVANVKVIDQQQRSVKVITSNETLGSHGFFRWDGDRDDGSKARMGYYIVWFEIFNSDGMVKTFRKRVIVSSRQ